MASLQRPTGPGGAWEHYCGANLIDERHVETNAHCVTVPGTTTALDPHELRLRIGSADNQAGGVLRQVTRVWVRAEWSWGDGSYPITADVAVLQLDRPVRLPPVPVAARPDPRWPVRLLGWGVTDRESTTRARFLQQLDVGLVSRTRCAADELGITDGEVCVQAADPDASPCSGDSGGPALQHRPDGRPALIASTSRGPTDDCRGPAIYTDVTWHQPWIRQVIRTGVVPPPAYPRSPAALPMRAAAQRWHHAA